LERLTPAQIYASLVGAVLVIAGVIGFLQCRFHVG
jgi:hypothetical protein